MKLGEKLISLRKAKGLTQLMVAEELNVSRQAISRWESETAMPSTENLRCLSELYDVPVDYLLHENSDRPVRVRDEKETGENIKNGKWFIWLSCIFIVIVVAVIIGAIAARSGPERVDFYEVESEDWNDKSTDDIPIVW